jgi:tetratricopeptide (TPR) repeat protein
MELKDALESAVDHQRNGRPDQAETIYRRILAEVSDHPDALHLLGLALHQQGKTAEGLEILGRAIGANPAAASYHTSMGVVRRELGRGQEAVESFRRATELDPDNADAFFNLGNALRSLAHPDDAEAAYKHSLALRPQNADVLNNLGTLLTEAGRHEEAHDHLRAATRIAPDDPLIQINLGVVLKSQDRFDEATEILEQAAALAPDVPEAHYNLGKALVGQAREQAAKAAFEKALDLDPKYADALTNLGAVLMQMGQPRDAVPCFRRVVELHPGREEAHTNLIKAYLNAEQALDAVSAYRSLAETFPGNADVHAQFGTCLLLTGQLPEGFAEYEWRWKSRLTEDERFSQPRWDGAVLEGRTLLLHAEQGMGDAIQFVRYAPMAAQRGAKVVVECFPPLRRLFDTLEGVDQVVSRDESLPPFDCHAPLVSLPQVFGTDLDSIPAAVPYLSVPSELRDAWRRRIGERDRLKVGLSWAGSRLHPNDSNRSIPAQLLRPLLDVPGVALTSLQVGDGADGLARLDTEGRIGDLAPFIEDFADSAAAIAELDLLISVDSAPVHLAGALGRPVWVMLSLVPDWRWMLERQDSPWYPGMRLFRQRKMGDWEDVVARVAKSLAAAAAGGGFTT